MLARGCEEAAIPALSSPAAGAVAGGGGGGSEDKEGRRFESVLSIIGRSRRD